MTVFVGAVVLVALLTSRVGVDSPLAAVFVAALVLVAATAVFVGRVVLVGATVLVFVGRAVFVGAVVLVGRDVLVAVLAGCDSGVTFKTASSR